MPIPRPRPHPAPGQGQAPARTRGAAPLCAVMDLVDRAGPLRRWLLMAATFAAAAVAAAVARLAVGAVAGALTAATGARFGPATLGALTIVLACPVTGLAAWTAAKATSGWRGRTLVRAALLAVLAELTLRHTPSAVTADLALVHRHWVITALVLTLGPALLALAVLLAEGEEPKRVPGDEDIVRAAALRRVLDRAAGRQPQAPAPSPVTRGANSHWNADGTAKAGYRSQTEAAQIAARQSEREGRAMTSYQCAEASCGMWHNGHNRYDT